MYEDQLPQIHPGQDVDITAEALPNRTLHGHVQFIEPTTNPQTRTVPVHVHLPNPGMRLMPGMFVSAMFVSRAAGPSVVVPRPAVLDTGTRKLVYVAKADGVFEAREIKVGAPTEDVFPVISGLKAGDKVVLNGNFMIDSQAQLSSGMTGLFGGSKEFANGQQGQAAGAPNAAPGGAKIELHAPGELKGGAGERIPGDTHRCQRQAHQRCASYRHAGDARHALDEHAGDEEFICSRVGRGSASICRQRQRAHGRLMERHRGSSQERSRDRVRAHAAKRK